MRLEEEIRALETMDLETLREQWRRRFGAPPKLRSVDLLRRLIAWRMQVSAYGGIDAPLKRRLEHRRDGVEHRLRPGARLAREWKGVRHEVEVVEGGFVHGGLRYRTLSQIARKIAGTRWNGPRFFGLRSEASQ